MTMLIIDQSTDLDTKDDYDSTPLLIAARHGYTMVAKVLLDTKRVRANPKDCFGRTPLWYARRYDYTELEGLLLEYLQEGNILISEADKPAKVDPRQASKSDRQCDVCTLDIGDGEGYYKCEQCDTRDFGICLECYEARGRCLNHSNELVWQEPVG